MDINTVKITKLPLLDGIEVKSATFMDKAFPLHFHQNWSLAYIETGSEHISFNQSEFLLSRNAWVLIPPHSLHKNWGEKNNRWSYKALYLNSDVIKKITSKLNLDYSYLSSYPYFISYSDHEFQVSQEAIFSTLETLFLNGIKNIDEINTSSRNQFCFNDLLDYLRLNYNSMITLDSLEKEFKINKYKLLKNFKRKIGLTPLEYQTSIRIENSKQLFYEDYSITEIALESGYYDQSHFTHSFKKYVGVTPGTYKQNSNILQDID